MAVMANFCGGTYRTRSAAMAADECINLYPEAVRGVKTKTLYGTPGLKPFGTASANNGNRGCFNQDGRTFRVCGGVFSEVNVATATETVWGTIPTDGNPVFMVSNGAGGEQLMVVGAGQVHIFNLATNTFLGPIALPLTNPAIAGVFIDGYFLILEMETIRVWFCALEDGTSWNALDFFARSHTSDNLVSIAVLHDRLYMIGSQTTEIFYDSGDLNTPFIPYPGTVMQEGGSSSFGTGLLGEALYWVSQDNLGRDRVIRTSNYQPEKISTDAIDFALAQVPDLSTGEVIIYTQEGHEFIGWTFANGDSLFFDATENEWHKRYGWNSATDVYTRYAARGACSTDAGVIVGDYATGQLYTLDLDTFTDNGQPRKWLRRAPYLSAENQWLFLDQIELLCQAAVGLISGQGQFANVMLRLSRDAAYSWTEAVFASMGQLGQSLNRCIWRSLGQVRADRLVIEISGTDPVRPAIGPGLALRATPGAGLL